MPEKRILFVPWNLKEIRREGVKESAGGEYASKNNRWVTAHRVKYARDEGAALPGKEVRQVWYTGKGSPLLGDLKTDDQVYIRGHCLVGLTGIFSYDDFTSDRQIVDDVVRDRLMARNTTMHNGAQVLYADEVVRRLGESGLKRSFDGVVKCYNCHSFEGVSNFAQSFADEMWSAGYRSCRIYGYRGALESFPAPGGHKTSTAGGRASENRYRVHPVQENR